MRASALAYKIWREPGRHGRFQIRIAHFWKLDEGTQSDTEPPQEWCLACDQNGQRGLASCRQE